MDKVETIIYEFKIPNSNKIQKVTYLTLVRSAISLFGLIILKYINSNKKGKTKL